MGACAAALRRGLATAPSWPAGASTSSSGIGGSFFSYSARAAVGANAKYCANRQSGPKENFVRRQRTELSGAPQTESIGRAYHGPGPFGSREALRRGVRNAKSRSLAFAWDDNEAGPAGGATQSPLQLMIWRRVWVMRTRSRACSMTRSMSL